MEAFVGVLRERRARIFKNPLKFDNVDTNTCLSKYRFDLDSIRILEELLREDIESATGRSHAVSTETKILTTLRYLAKGDFYSEVAEIHSISKASVCRHLFQVVRAINRRLPIKFAENLQERRESFHDIAQIPGVIGAVDGTLIQIKCPTKEEEAAYVCRKGYHAINIQAVVDARMRFTNVVAKWPGATHDSRVFDQSYVKQYLEERPGIGWLLGDCGYPLRPYCLTPVVRPANRAEELYNRAQRKTRNVVERAFGLLKIRFRCLDRSGGCLPFAPDKCCQVVLACCRLHNMAVERGLPQPVEDVELDGNDDVLFQQAVQPARQRNRQTIINMFRN